MASSAPDTTTAAGPLTAATPHPSNVANTSASDAATANIPPPAGNACINRPRAATNTHASASDSTPATYAAVTSPTECPPTKSGTTPNDSTNRNNATSTANNPACVNTVSSNNPDPPNNTGRNGSGNNGSSREHTS